MKKSEMLDRLQLFFQSDCAFEDAHDARISAERVLAIVEAAGMMPPWRDIDKDCFCSSRGSCPGCQPELFTPTWDLDKST